MVFTRANRTPTVRINGNDAHLAPVWLMRSNGSSEAMEKVTHDIARCAPEH
jgi:hypothetical protein